MDASDGAAAAYPGALEDDVDDVGGPQEEQGMSDGEDEEMIMLHVRFSKTPAALSCARALTGRTPCSPCAARSPQLSHGLQTEAPHCFTPALTHTSHVGAWVCVPANVILAE